MTQSGTSLPVVLVDDEPTVLLSSRMVLGSAGIKDVLTVEDSRRLMTLLAEQEVAVVVLDLFMPYLSGTQLLPQIVKEHPELPVIVMTASQEIETAVACMKEGAFDYLVKPVEESRFRLSVHQVDIPPLRERKEDIAVLAAFFAAEMADSLGKKPLEISPELLTLLNNYHFPGNVRELRAMVVDAVARHNSGPVLAAKSFRKTVKKQVNAAPTGKKETGNAVSDGRFPTLKEAERLHIGDALQRAGGNQGTAAALLGISRPALNRRLARM